MVKRYEKGVYYIDGRIVDEKEYAQGNKEEGRKKTIIYDILASHNQSGNMQQLNLRFDALASHDITYVGIIQTARASGLKVFEKPYVLTNCHNSLCAVGGTINEDDHVFGLSAARKYGGIYVPAHQAVIHQYMREQYAGCGKMILGSDSHTRYGALGTAAVGEGGPELVKQLLNKTYDIDYPKVVLVYLDGEVKDGVGPQDVALTLIKAVFDNGYVKNKVMEFAGPGVAALSVEYRMGIDVMTTETTCLSSVWETDEKVQAYLDVHGRKGDYRQLKAQDGAYYDGCLFVDLAQVRPSIALPFHPSNVYTIQQVKENAEDIFHLVEKNAAQVLEGIENFSLRDKITPNGIQTSQGIIAGCAGGMYENILYAAQVLKGHNTGDGAFSLSVYPSSQPVMEQVVQSGAFSSLLLSGAIIKTAFCGPCFGAGDVPANGALSIRHTTRNFPNREGSKPGEGQIASVALMDARSIAATALNGGILTGADEIDIDFTVPEYRFDKRIYQGRVYDGWQCAQPEEALQFGPNIAPWPAFDALADDVLLQIVSVIDDAVTTTDELIPSGEAASYRSNPMRLAEFTLSRKDPGYVGRAKEVQSLQEAHKESRANEKLLSLERLLRAEFGFDEARIAKTALASAIYARRPGDGSAREQAASSQKVLGGGANIAYEYATKRYRSNLINWGMLPLIFQEEPCFKTGDWILLKDVRQTIESGVEEVSAWLIRAGKAEQISLSVPDLSEDERQIILAGCLINFYRN